MKIKFWGVRGSHPVSGKGYVEFGGNTTCLSVEVANKIFIIDAGTGIINLDEELYNKYDEFNILFTHTHIDHIQGFMFFKPLYSKFKKINLYGPNLLGESFFESLKKIMGPSIFPVGIESMIGINNVKVLKDREKIELDLEKGKLIIEPKYLKEHPLGGVYAYKFSYNNKSFVFATDIESKIEGFEDLIDFSKEVDLLIHDAQYEEKEYKNRIGWGHSTSSMAAVNARLAKVKQLCLTHYNSHNTDEIVKEKLIVAKKEFLNTILAKDLLEINL